MYLLHVILLKFNFLSKPFDRNVFGLNFKNTHLYTYYILYRYIYLRAYSVSNLLHNFIFFILFERK